jgi:hypothetical protein
MAPVLESPTITAELSGLTITLSLHAETRREDTNAYFARVNSVQKVNGHSQVAA